ncbi:MAG: Sulfur carrier protein ThiS adenylyltransferase [Alphaproteobacteria bacterium MarineAlpha6_Bin2]|nr:MAG: Sulfur carrier protein ThiS adenylyltransferase [Alphaproteobacteria bacterium MarineAlpha6_Bin2]
MSKLSENQIQRYAHQIILDEIGIKGQEKLLKAKVFILGIGGLGSPVLMYLASAGIGTLGIADFDKVELSNLQRQILFDTKSINKLKVEIAKKKINSINPNVKINIYKKKITNLNINKIIPEYDIVVDGSDNFETKYLINDACIKNKKILISASLNGFEAQIITFKPWIKSTNNPCYRCLFPENYKNTNTYNCREGGIIGGLAGTIGSLQSVEVIKEILNIGESLNGKLLIIDLLNGNLKKLKVKRNKKCLNYCKFLIKD